MAMLLLSSLVIIQNASATKTVLYGPDGFESGVTPWAEKDPGRGLAQSSTKAYDGSYSLLFPASPGNTNAKRAGLTLPTNGCNFTWWEYNDGAYGSVNNWFTVCNDSIGSYSLLMYYAPYAGSDIQILSNASYHGTGIQLPVDQWNLIKINLTSDWKWMTLSVNGGSYSSPLWNSYNAGTKTCIYRQGETGGNIYMDDFEISYGLSTSSWKPTFTSSPSTTGQKYTYYSYHVTLNESGPITGISIPADLTLINNGTGTNVWLNGTFTATGAKSVKLKGLSGSGGLYEYQNFTITVGEAALTGFKTYPYINAFNNSHYEYPSNVSGTSISYSINSNASWLDVGSSNGTVYGRPSYTNVNHTYYVELTADNGTASVIQNYTVRVWDMPQCADNAACEPLANLAYESAIIGGGYLYVAYSGTGTTPGNVDIYINRCDLSTGIWDAPYDLGSGVTDYDHSQSRILLDEYGYIHVFYGAHSSRILYVRSLVAYSISSWTSIQQIGDLYCTYPSPILAPNGDIYVFYRDRVQWSPEVESWGYIKSTNNGASWSSTSIFLNWWDTYTPAKEVPYVFDFYPTYYPNSMCVGFVWDVMNYSVASGVSIGVHQNVYYAYFNTSTGHCYNVSGYDLGTSITTSEKAKCLVWDTKAIDILVDVEDETIIRGYNERTPHFFVDENTSEESTFHESYIARDGNHWDAPVQITIGYSFKENMQGYLIGDTIYAYASVDVTNDSIRTFGGDIQQWRYNTTTDIWTCDGTIFGHTQTQKSLVYAGVCQWVRNASRPVIIFSETNCTNSIYSGGSPGDFYEGLNIYAYAYDTGFVYQGNPPALNFPVITSTPVTTCYIGVNYSYQVVATGALNYSLSTNATWLSIDTVTGLITGTPNATGWFWVNITVTNSDGATTQSFVLTITPVPYYITLASWLGGIIPLLLLLILLAIIAKVSRSARE